MNYKKPKAKAETEQGGSDRLRTLMHREGWYTKKTHGNLFSKDWPDLLCMHPRHGVRWVETKTHQGYLSDGQIREFAKWAEYGILVWVLRDERDYRWLFEDANWYKFALPMRQRPL